MIELSLIHDGKLWIAKNEDFSAKAGSLPELDREISTLLKQTPIAGKPKSVKVRMTFDNSVIPEWIRQYSNHYFNRIVTLDLS